MRTSITVEFNLFTLLLGAVDPETSQTMPEERLVDNLLTFLLAGHHTIAVTLTWTLYLLSRAPEWEARILEEIQQVVPSGLVTGEHIDRLVTVQQVLKESMRLYPPLAMMTRYTAKDVELAGEHIKAGTLIGLPIYVIHRHCKLWGDPDRFAPEREARYSRYQFMPSGAGPRICIGAAFAFIEATAMLATLVRAARFESPPVQEPIPVSRVVLLPKDGMPLVEQASKPMKVETQEKVDFTEYLDATAWMPGISTGVIGLFLSQRRMPPEWARDRLRGKEASLIRE